MEHGPAKNLRNTPGRRAIIVAIEEKEKQSGFTLPLMSESALKRKRRKSKRKSPKSDRSDSKDTKSSSKKYERGSKVNKDTTQRSVRQLFQEQTNKGQEDKLFYNLLVGIRIKKLEDGYLTDPELFTRSECIREQNSQALLDKRGLFSRSLSSQSVDSHYPNIELTCHSSIRANQSRGGDHQHQQSVGDSIHTSRNIAYEEFLEQLKSKQSEVYEASNKIDKSDSNRKQVAPQFTQQVEVPEFSPNICLADDCNHMAGEVLGGLSYANTPGVNRDWQEYIKRQPWSIPNHTSSNYSPTSAIMSSAGSTCITTTTYSSAGQLLAQQMMANPTYAAANIGSATNIQGMVTTNSVLAPNLNAPIMAVPAVEDQPNDLKPIYAMFQHITNMVSVGTTATQALRNEVQAYNDKLEEVQDEMESQGAVVNETVKETISNTEEISLLKTMVSKHEKQMSKMLDRMEDSETKHLRRNLLIFGIPEQKEEDALKIVKDFFKIKMEFQEEIPFVTAYRRGVGEHRPMLIQLQNIRDKALIYKNVKKLKDKTNDNGQSYQVRDDLPERLREQDKRYRFLMGKGRNNTALQIKRTTKTNQLTINGSVYKIKAPLPTDSQILELTREEKEELQRCKLITTKPHREKGNYFCAYGAEASSLDKVRTMQKHLRLKHAGATHIVSTYHIASPMPDMQDFDDNGEYGCGARVLKLIQEKNKSNVAVFLVRYHSGTNLGKRRFEIFSDLATSILEMMDEEEQYQWSKLDLERPQLKRWAKRTRGGVMGNRGGAHNILRKSAQTKAKEFLPEQTTGVYGAAFNDSDSEAEVVLQTRAVRKSKPNENGT